MTAADQKARWFYPTPDRLVLLLLVAELLLLCPE
jgi:hypothetical protein